MNAPLRLALDEVAPQHAWIHSQLDLWGRASRIGNKRLYCGSIESRYRVRAFDFQPAPRPIELAAEEFRSIDRAILGLPELHRRLLAEYYVRNCPLDIIRRRLKIHFSHFAKLMFNARAGVLNQLRRN